MEASHVPGAHNRLADALSCDKLSYFLPKAWAMDQSPSPIPAKLLELIQDMQKDWTSAAWRNMFYFDQSLTPSTHKTYQAAANSVFHISTPYPLTQHILCQYVS